MPAYDFSCSKGHVTEHFMSYADLESGQRFTCGFEGCEEVAGEYCPSFWYNSPVETTRRIQNAQRFSLIVIHRDAHGNIRYPGHADAPVPEGFQKVELTDFHQVRKFEKEVNERDSVRSQEFANTRDKFLSGQLKENRRVMEQLVHNFTPRGRKFYEKMREISEDRRLRGRNTSKPAFFVEALSMDASNREGYYDARNDWGKHHGSGK